MQKSPLEHASHKLSQAIFLGAIFLFVLVAALTALNYFTQGAVVDVISRFDKSNVTEEVIQKELVIGTAAPATSMSPLNFEFQNRMVLNNVYEGLVALDPSLQVKQALAVTFGQLDDLTWEFRLREGVKFQNGLELSANDVIKSFKAAMEEESSQLKSVLSNIEDITAADGKIQITTKKPDPTFLNKLATVYIFKNFGDGEQYGTGAYSITAFGQNEVKLKRFEEYWGSLPHFKEARYVYVQDKDQRLTLFEEGEVDLLRNVPYQLLPEISTDTSLVIKQPSLEVTFLGYGFESTDLFQHDDMHTLLAHVIDKEELTTRFGSAVIPARQFVSNGVVGYSPYQEEETEGLSTEELDELITRITEPEQLEEPSENDDPEAEKSAPPKPEFYATLDFSIGLTSVAQYIQDELEEAGVPIKLRALDGPELLEALTSGESEMYLLGWKSEFGDAIDFYKVLAHSKKGSLGEFNAGSYNNAEVDTLIAKSDNTFNPLQRVKILQNIMEIVLIEDPMGMPLFETQIIYAVQKDRTFIPRIDGYVNVNEVK